MFFMFMPLERHYDDGFGATGDAFKEAADKLQAAHPDGSTEFLRHLPLNYLRRHACELYLKSGIVIFHRWLNLAYGKADPRGAPFVGTKKGWEPLNRVHRLSVLYDYWSGMVAQCTPTLAEITNVDWSLPSEMTAWIAIVDAADSDSTLFRYPTTKNRQQDRAKSSIKPTALSRLMSVSKKDRRGYVLVDDECERTEAYRADSDAVGEVSRALGDLTPQLFRYHALMRSKLTGGL